VNESFNPGQEYYLASHSPSAPYSAFFEDDGETGYFYAWEQGQNGDGRILDTVHIYNVASVVDRERDSRAEISWSIDGMKAMLSINGYPHAAFDFDAKRGYGRTNFPNFPHKSADGWRKESHEWDDGVMNLFCRDGNDRSGQP
jgi:hypothetical protein